MAVFVFLSVSNSMAHDPHSDTRKNAGAYKYPDIQFAKGVQHAVAQIWEIIFPKDSTLERKNIKEEESWR